MTSGSASANTMDALLNFNVDHYLNPFVPSSKWIRRLPQPVARFLGHREQPPKKICSALVWLWAFVGGFCGIALIEAVYRRSGELWSHHPPIVIGSFGAAAILEYQTIESPLAQPRNLVGGQLLSAIIGVGITKLFQLLPAAQFEDLRWLAGALAVGSSSAVMGITNTVHPPAGATALLAATDSQISDLGWWLLPFVLIGCALMMGSALIIDNIQRQWPVYWWTPMDVSKTRWWRKTEPDEEKKVEKPVENPLEKRPSHQSDSTLSSGETSLDKKSAETPSEEIESFSKDYFASEPEIRINNNKILVPEWMELDAWQKQVLLILRQELREGQAAGDRRKELQ